MGLLVSNSLRNFSKHISQLNSELLLNIFLTIIFQTVFVLLKVAYTNFVGHNPDPVFMHIRMRQESETKRQYVNCLLPLSCLQHTLPHHRKTPCMTWYDCSRPVQFMFTVTYFLITVLGFCLVWGGWEGWGVVFWVSGGFWGVVGFFFKQLLWPLQHSRIWIFLQMEIPPSLLFKACIFCPFINSSTSAAS